MSDNRNNDGGMGCFSVSWVWCAGFRGYGWVWNTKTKKTLNARKISIQDIKKKRETGIEENTPLKSQENQGV